MSANTGRGLKGASERPRRCPRLLLVLTSCALLSCVRDPRSHDPKDVAAILVPPHSTITEDSDWVVTTWSAQKAYAFEIQLTQGQYLSWAKTALGPDWHCHRKTDGAILYTRLLSGEQQDLEIRPEDGDSQAIRVRVIFTATPT